MFLCCKEGQACISMNFGGVMHNWKYYETYILLSKNMVEQGYAMKLMYNIAFKD
jgi:hypothetical protein